MKEPLLVIVTLAGAVLAAQPAPLIASEFATEHGSAYDEWFYGTPYEKLVDRLTRILAWYDKYLKPAASSGTPQP